MIEEFWFVHVSRKQFSVLLSASIFRSYGLGMLPDDLLLLVAHLARRLHVVLQVTFSHSTTQ